MFKIIFAVIGRDLRLAMRRQADIVSALFFFVIVVSLFPLGIGPEPQLLKKLAPGVLWVSALLATMLSLPRLFADDYRDGTLEQLVLAPQPLGLTVIGSSAMFTVFTYITPILQTQTNASLAFVTAMLVVYGVGLTVGN